MICPPLQRCALDPQSEDQIQTYHEAHTPFLFLGEAEYIPGTNN